MSLDKIVNKKVLERTPEEVLLPEFLGTALPQPVEIPQVIEIYEIYKQEVTKWDDLIEEVEKEELLDLPPTLDVSKEVLQDWLYTGDLYWADNILSFEEYYWKSGKSIGGMLYGTLMEVREELNSSLDFLASRVQKQDVLSKEISSIYEHQAWSAKSLREKISKSIEKAKKKLPECYIKKVIKLISNKLNLSYSIDGKRKDILDLIKAVRAVIRYKVLNDKIDWKETRKNILNRLAYTLASKTLEDIALKLSQIEREINIPIIDLVSDVVETLLDEDCDAFDDLIEVIVDETKKIRLDLVSKIYEIKDEISKKYDSRIFILKLADNNLEMNRHLSVLDTVLESLEFLLSFGYLDDKVVEYINDKIKNK